MRAFKTGISRAIFSGSCRRPEGEPEVTNGSRTLQPPHLAKSCIATTNEPSWTVERNVAPELPRDVTAQCSADFLSVFVRLRFHPDTILLWLGDAEPHLSVPCQYPVFPAVLFKHLSLLPSETTAFIACAFSFCRLSNVQDAHRGLKCKTR